MKRALCILVGAALVVGGLVAVPVAMAQIGGAWTYSQVKAATGEISIIINADRKKLDAAMTTAITRTTEADNSLGSLAATYASVGTAIDNAVASDPTNAAYLALDAEWDELVSEFTTLKADAAAQKTALEEL